jgi:hypothetical protein
MGIVKTVKAVNHGLNVLAEKTNDFNRARTKVIAGSAAPAGHCRYCNKKIPKSNAVCNKPACHKKAVSNGVL